MTLRVSLMGIFLPSKKLLRFPLRADSRDRFKMGCNLLHGSYRDPERPSAVRRLLGSELQRLNLAVRFEIHIADDGRFHVVVVVATGVESMLHLEFAFEPGAEHAVLRR